jgi:hypothetical protein
MTNQPQPVFDPSHELQRSAELLVKQPVLALPIAAASVATVVVIFAAVLAAIASIITVAAVPHGAAAFAALIPGIGLGFTVIVGSYALATLVTICAAPDVLSDRRVDWRAALHRAAAGFWNFALLVLIGGCSMLVLLPLCFVLVGIPLVLAAWYFTTFASVAVALDGQDAFTALSTSFRIARTRVPECLVAWVGIVIAFAIGATVNGALGHLPFINVVAAFLVGGFTGAYSELVRVRFYLALRVPGTPSTLTTNAYAAPYVPPTAV